MFAAFIGGWELILILMILGGLVTVPLIIIAVVWFISRQQKKDSVPPSPAPQQFGQ